MQALVDRLTDKQSMDFIAQIEQPFKNLPHLPAGLTGFLAMIAPYLSLLGGVLSIFAAVALLPLVMGASAVGMMVGETVNPVVALINIVLMVLSGILALLAFKPLRDRAMRGWVLMFWGQVLGIVSSLVGLLGGDGNIIGFVIGLVIGFYVLFEMKREYGKAQELKAKVS
ncbi:MAG TPA: hypothetical protein VD999_04955 [Vitreimonas sp.]|nr:hypothetical protein [Vitreimonas sp.]